ncbi:hypothetical protein VIM7927_00103 [Vibrio mangrovi]|nr:hypothetical protein VIM7927_00103 [Vibrio mangrovi]
MKRSRQVVLAHMKKDWRCVTYTPITVVIAGIALSGCGDSGQDAVIYKTVDDCINDNPSYTSECKAAYQNAVEEASRTAPRYGSLNECIAEFGVDMCRPDPGHSNWFMPAMAGFMFARMLDGPRPYYTQPMFYSDYPFSPYYHQWSSASGNRYGDTRYKTSRVKVHRDQMKPKPTVTRTISRGGFGSTASAKSSWGSSSSRSFGSSSRGWGG